MVKLSYVKISKSLNDKEHFSEIFVPLAIITTLVITVVKFSLALSLGLVATFYSFREKILEFINPKILKLKLILVSILIVVALISVPIISLPGNDFLGFNLKFFKHALEWDYFLGIISFYLLTFLMWKKN